MPEPLTVAFVALGCAKNLVDSEKMLGQLVEGGAVLTADESEADVIVINTCGFLEVARTEAHEEIAAAVARKRKGRCRRVVVAGCLVQRDGTRLLEDIPGVDALVGVHQRDDILRAVLGTTSSGNGNAPDRRPGKTTRRGAAGALTGGFRLPAGRNKPITRPVDLYLGDYHPYVATDTARLRLTPRHYAYLRVSEGCNQKCTFCTIPAIRGPLHSKPVPAILAEARELINDGAVELNLIGQDTTSYGQDIDYAAGLAGLLRELNALDGARWIRLLYAYPSVFTDEMIDTIAESDRVVKYIDIPLQHINDRMLKAMHRRVTRAQTEALLRKLRDRIPGVTIRTTFIAGFPGETEAEFEELLQFVRDCRFSAVGVFPYSLEPDTPAGRMEDQLPAEVKEARADAIMEVQQQVAFESAAARTGSFMEVLIDRAGGRGQYVGRHAGQAPEVDANTIVLGRDLAPGEFVRVLCERSDGYDLIGRPSDAILPVL